MAANKTIFECPVISLVSELDGGNRLVIQKGSGSFQDNGLPLSILAQWLGGNSQAEIYGGGTNPDSAQGANGDLYIQTNGKIYRKVAGAWVLKATIGGGSVSYAIEVGTDVRAVFIPSTDFTELATLQCIDVVTNIRWDVQNPVLHYTGGNFDGWAVVLPVPSDEAFLTVNDCVVWVS